MSRGNDVKVSRLALAAMLVAVMLVLGFIESLIPLGPVPGIKLGLSNSVLLLSLYWLGIPLSIQLMLVKVFLSGFLFGNLMAIQYSLAGGVLSLLAMILLIYGVKGFSPVGAGIAGAVMHNVGQVLVAMLVLQTTQLLYYLAILVLVGIATGAVTGSVATLLMKHLRYTPLRAVLPNK
ncbi:MAG: Gx transporter family protein [Christensenellales bacterium]